MATAAPQSAVLISAMEKPDPIGENDASVKGLGAGIANAGTALEQRIHAEKIRALARNMPFTNLTGGVIAVLAAAGSARVVGGWVWQWLAGYGLLMVIRYVGIVFYRRSPRQEDGARRWGYLLSANLGLVGLLWLVFGFGAFLPDNPIHALFVAIILTGLTAASLASLSAYTPAMLCYAARRCPASSFPTRCRAAGNTCCWR